MAFTVHGSRFDGATGRCVMGPSYCDLHPENDLAKKLTEKASSRSKTASLLAGGAGVKTRLETGGIPGAQGLK